MYQVEIPKKRWQLIPEEQGDESTVNEINELLSSENYEAAFPKLRELADKVEGNAHINVVTGLVAISVGSKTEAEFYFNRALKADPNDADALHNSAVLSMANGDIETAQNHFERLAEIQPINATVYNDLAIIWMNKSNTEKVKECFSKAIELNPNFMQCRKNAMEFALSNGMLNWGMELLGLNNKQPGLTSASVKDIHLWIKVIANEQQQAEWATATQPTAPTSLQLSRVNGKIQDKKIAFFASHKAFVTNIMKRLRENNNEIREFNLDSNQSMPELMEWADLAWFEWCDNLLIEATKRNKKCPIVCRLHSYEAFTDMPASVDWSKVDQLIFVNRSVEEIARPLINQSVPWTVIHNGVDCEKFKIPKSKQYGKKIASVGYINYKKNPTLLLYCFKKIHEYDPEYTFHVAGAHQDARIKLYFDNFLKENPLPITFYGWVNDMPNWYSDKDYIISTSLFESFHYSIAEGMASGLIPLIHNWFGVKYVYPGEYVFNDPDDCLELLKRMELMDKQDEAEKNRRFITGRYNLDDKFNQLARLLSKVASK